MSKTSTAASIFHKTGMPYRVINGEFQIDHGMVMRFMNEMVKGKWSSKWDTSEAIKAGLNAALNPIGEPEITVTDEMALAGSMTLTGTNSHTIAAGDVYRAMHALAPKVEMVCPTCRDSPKGRHDPIACPPILSEMSWAGIQALTRHFKDAPGTLDLHAMMRDIFTEMWRMRD